MPIAAEVLRARRAASGVSARTIAVGDRVGDWVVVAVVGESPRPSDRSHAGKLRVELRCDVCGHTKSARVDNLRISRNRCAWANGPSLHVGRPRRATAAGSPG